MRFTSLIAIAAIIMLIAAVGCSNNGRATGPMDNSSQSLQLNGDGTNSARFENSPAVPDITPNLQDVDVITGYYHYDSKNQCRSIMISKDNFVELVSQSNIPIRIKNGSLVHAYGNYNAVPGYHCQYSVSFTFQELVIARSNSTSGPNNGSAN